MLAGNTQKASDFRLAVAGWPVAGMSSASSAPGWDGQRSGLRWAECSFMMSCSLMILFKINSTGMAILEFKSDAPETIHMHTVARGPLALELVKIKAWQIHLFGPLDGIETIKTQ